MTLEQLIRELAQRLNDSPAFYGHGNDNAFDEAAELAFFSTGFRHEDAPDCYKAVLDEGQVSAARALVERRIETRLPAAYLTRRMWFCGHEFYVDERVLVPRSPIAELIETQFHPWVQPERVQRVLDIGTGSGCIAIATALALPQAQVDAADLSEDALAVTRMNIARHNVQARVRAVQSDVFSGLDDEVYDLIVSNPPYVSHAEMDELPVEYLREPALGLRAGADGLDIVRRILAKAEEHLTPHGALIVEVGDSEATLAEAFPRVPFMWLEFARGGGGVFVLSAAELKACRAEFR